MYCLIGAEAAIFTIFVVAYLFYMGKSLAGPKAKDVLHVPIFYTICLLSSSITVHAAGLTINTNLFGTTYYSLVGLHAFHVTMGLLALITVALFYFGARLRREHAERLEILSLYWHFVDAVWVVVFLVVYVIGV